MILDLPFFYILITAFFSSLMDPAEVYIVSPLIPGDLGFTIFRFVEMGWNFNKNPIQNLK